MRACLHEFVKVGLGMTGFDLAWLGWVTVGLDRLGLVCLVMFELG